MRLGVAGDVLWWLCLGCCRACGFVRQQLSFHRFLIAGSFRPCFPVWAGGCGGLGAVFCWAVRGWGLWWQWCATGERPWRASGIAKALGQRHRGRVCWGEVLLVPFQLQGRL